MRRRGDPRTLVRRPSYRKILTELGGHQNMINGEQLFLKFEIFPPTKIKKLGRPCLYDIKITPLNEKAWTPLCYAMDIIVLVKTSF